MQGFSSIHSIIINVCIILFLINSSAAKTSKGCSTNAKRLKKGDKVVTIGGLHGIIERR